ncbi:hypothetical protein HOM13_02870 [Candidatus Woesearchaeota archaeon]|jgi:uncharacterized protein (UPF0332 family)|nr:hypothetical protein [Candidatus Woesearchaeota archaeon]MBT5215653.1 hypothetical protein [Candidatus Woesearchaeota archaeon]MBT6402476.1 hypothetical protein [Candidatus Woesearchaeota archaeon]
MDWEECNQKRIVKNVDFDEGLISSLIQTSKKKMKSQEFLPFNDTTLASKVSLAYDSLRELLEALTLKKGFKIYNHECYTSFLKEIMNKSSLGDDFDEIRKLRNDINYYGKELSLGECKDMISRINELKMAVENIMNKTKS